jgi:hypothetical protein
VDRVLEIGEMATEVHVRMQIIDMAEVKQIVSDQLIVGLDVQIALDGGETWIGDKSNPGTA